MKPLKLHISGIKSFTDGQDIDFERLSQNRLFGIFGETASGKSTILTSIIIALFGEEDKIYQRDFINLNRNEAYIEFDFSAREDGITSLYRCERSFRIRKSGTTDNKARLLKQTAQGMEVQEDTLSGVNKRIESIIGLSASEFKKCVILPQGEFASFLKSDRSSRLEIIGKLFDLGQFGDALYRKASDYRANLYNSMAEYNKLLESLQSVQDIDIEAQKQSLSQLKEDCQSTQQKYQKLKNQNAQNAQLIQAAEDYRAAAVEEQRLLAKKLQIDQMELSLQAATRAKAVLPHISAHKAALARAESLKNDCDQKTAGLTAAQQAYATAKERFLQAKQRMEDEYDINQKRHATLCALLPQVTERAKLESDIKKVSDEYKSERQNQQQFAAAAQSAQTKAELLTAQLKTIKARLDADNQQMRTMSKGAYSKGRQDEALHAAEFLSGKQAEYFADRARVFLQQQEEYSPQKLLTPQQREQLSAQEQLVLEQIKKQDELKSIALQKQAQSTTRMEAAATQGSEQRQRLEKAIAQLKGQGADFSDGEKLQAYADELEKANAALKASYQNSENGFKQAELKRNSLAEQLNLAKGIFAEHQLSTYDIQAQLQTELERQGFSDAQQATQAALSKEQETQLKTHIDSYKDSLKAAQAESKRLSALIDGKQPDKELHAKLLQEEEQLHARMLDLVEQSAVLNQKIEDWEQQLCKLKESKKEIASLKKEHDTADLLCQLTRGKKFMEYAAEECIGDIAASATQHINKLSGGRYALVYRPESFFVEDNYSGGQLRKVLTLSGGETFLVSLSLAVALSEAIVKRSDRAMEFFFLDEGFGTLDKELCDTVMQSLERLRQSHFTIGLISHVPELMHRMDYRLYVNPPTDSKGSTVQHYTP